jgi:uncharacterized protein with PQ loop repeat
MSAPSILALLASAVFLARLLPQPLRTRRTGRIEGVSALSALNAAIADSGWMVYGVAAGLPAVWGVSIPAVALSVVTAALLRRSITRSTLVVAGSWAAAVAGAAIAGGEALDLVLAATVVVCCGPAVWSAFRSDHPEGLTAWTWWLAVADALSWGGYGLAIGDPALELYGAVMLATAMALLLRLRTTRNPALA